MIWRLFLHADGALAQSSLPDKVIQLVQLSARLTGQLAPLTLDTLERHMAVINSYYSNLIEGNATRPHEIRAAQRGDYDADLAQRDIQLESLAHMAVQEWIRKLRPDLDTLYSPDFILQVYHEFYSRIPESLWLIKDAQSNAMDTVVAGASRTRLLRSPAYHARDRSETRREFMKSTLAYITLAAGLLSCSSIAVADKTILAGGCFWCMESDFEKLDGVSDVVSGFTGGTAEDPTYNGNHEGHFESVEITYDPQQVSYKELLDYYWVNIDPFDNRGQFCDKGPSYLSAIFVANDEERKISEQSKMEVEKEFPNQKVVTPILNAATFYPIKGDESYHQDYYKKSAVRYEFYRWSCGRDARLEEIWGDRATH